MPPSLLVDIEGEFPGCPVKGLPAGKKGGGVLPDKTTLRVAEPGGHRPVCPVDHPAPDLADPEGGEGEDRIEDLGPESLVPLHLLSHHHLVDEVAELGDRLFLVLPPGNLHLGGVVHILEHQGVFHPCIEDKRGRVAMGLEVLEELDPVHLGEELDPVHFREVVVGDDHIVGPALEDLERLFGGRDGVDPDLSALLKGGTGALDQVGVVMDQEYGDHPLFFTIRSSPRRRLDRVGGLSNK